MVEEGTVSEAEALARKHPIAAFSLDALTAGAAKLRPDRLALTEAGPGGPTRALTYREFDAQVRAVAQHLADLGLAPGERTLEAVVLHRATGAERLGRAGTASPAAPATVRPAPAARA